MRRKLLIVEDDEQVAEILFDLTREKFDVRLAVNFSEAKAALETDKPDLIITDFNFPGGDGREVAILARQIGCNKIILHSSAAENHLNDPVYSKAVHKFDIDNIIRFLE